MYSNAAINPIIYGGFNENFRKSFKDLINGIAHRNSPSASESFETEYKQRSTLRARNTVNGTKLKTVAEAVNGSCKNGDVRANKTITEETKTETIQNSDHANEVKPDIVLDVESTTDNLMISSKL